MGVAGRPRGAGWRWRPLNASLEAWRAQHDAWQAREELARALARLYHAVWRGSTCLGTLSLLATKATIPAVLRRGGPLERIDSLRGARNRVTASLYFAGQYTVAWPGTATLKHDVYAALGTALTRAAMGDRGAAERILREALARAKQAGADEMARLVASLLAAVMKPTSNHSRKPPMARHALLEFKAYPEPGMSITVASGRASVVRVRGRVAAKWSGPGDYTVDAGAALARRAASHASMLARLLGEAEEIACRALVYYMVLFRG